MLCRLRGRQYRFNWTNQMAPDDAGQTDDPASPKPQIRIRTGLPNEMEIVIHEALHACFWDLSEESVAEAAKDIAGLMAKLGYERRGG